MTEENLTQETEEEAGDAEQESVETAEEPASETPTPPKPPANEMKIVIIMNGDRALLGVQAPECDPVYTTMEGDLGKALKRVPKLVTEAKQKWATTPKNPKADLPEPPPPPVPARTTTATRSTTPTPQQPMF